MTDRQVRVGPESQVPQSRFGPSDKAVEAAAVATATLRREGVGNPGPDFFSTPYARAALAAAHDPALGLDASGCLRDVAAELERLREENRCLLIELRSAAALLGERDGEDWLRGGAATFGQHLRRGLADG